MTKEEFTQLFNYIFLEEKEKPLEPVKFLFWDQFGKLEKEEFSLAVRSLKQKKTFGAPKCSDVWEVIRELRAEKLPASLKMSAAEALTESHSTKLLIADARHLANRVVPGIGGHVQFDSPMELDKANRINRAIWEREFKERFERKKQEALSLVAKGAKPTEAILITCGLSSTKELTAPERKLLSDVFNAGDSK